MGIVHDACFFRLLSGALSRFHSCRVTSPGKPAETVVLTRFKNWNGPAIDGTAGLSVGTPNSVQNFHQIRRTFFSVPGSLFVVLWRPSSGVV
jgi:hypothetical protein